MDTKVTRRGAIAGGLSLAIVSLLNDSAAAQEKCADESCWTYVQLDPQKVGQAVYENFAPNGCMYGAVKGAVLVFAETTSCAKDQAAARAFPFQAVRYGRAGAGHLKELCGAVNGALMFMSLFVEDYAELRTLAAKLAEYSAKTALPEFKPEKDECPDMLRVAANGITCREMGGAWMKAATEEQKKVVLERCKRHAASITAKSVEILNEYFAEKG